MTGVRRVAAEPQFTYKYEAASTHGCERAHMVCARDLLRLSAVVKADNAQSAQLAEQLLDLCVDNAGVPVRDSRVRRT